MFFCYIENEVIVVMIVSEVAGGRDAVAGVEGVQQDVQLLSADSPHHQSRQVWTGHVDDHRFTGHSGPALRPGQLLEGGGDHKTGG